MEKTYKLLMCQMPNYIGLQRPPKKREDGIEGWKISITELSPTEAEAYAEEMKQAFLKHYFDMCEKQKSPHSEAMRQLQNQI